MGIGALRARMGICLAGLLVSSVADPSELRIDHLVCEAPSPAAIACEAPVPVLLTAAPAPSQPRAGAQETAQLRIGGTGVLMHTYRRGEGVTTYVGLHHNESAGRDAARRMVDEHGGALVWLEYPGTRRIAFTLDGKRYEFDPNGMFTDAGIRRSLEMYGKGNYSPQAHAAVREFATSFLERSGIDEARMLVAPHNNWGGGFSAKSYAGKSVRRTKDAVRVSLAPGVSPDDFFIVTEQGLFDSLSAKDFNVVLQDNKGCLDDGSLAVYAARRSIPYANAEAQHARGEYQFAMLSALRRVAEAPLYAVASPAGR